jgi:3-hydroxypropanoate dehydrogenase
MTLLADPRTDLVDFEADVSALLAIEAPAPDILFRDAWTANAFTDEPVTDALMRAIYDLAKWVRRP